MMFAVTLLATFIVVMLDYNCKLGFLLKTLTLNNLRLLPLSIDYVKYDQQGYSDIPSQVDGVVGSLSGAVSQLR